MTRPPSDTGPAAASGRADAPSVSAAQRGRARTSHPGQRQSRNHRRRRRVHRVVTLVVVLATLGAGTTLLLGVVSAQHQPAARVGASTKLASSRGARPTTRLGPPPPYAVTSTQMTFVDTTRGTGARGSQPAHSGRTLVTTIVAPSSPAVGPFPLVVFAHGYDQSVATYLDLLRTVAAGGYVVAAPDFPLTSTAFPGPPSRNDVLNQPADLSFLITAIRGAAAAPGPLSGLVAAGKVGVMGHSDGAVTAAAVAFNSCCADPRVGGAIILSGAESDFHGSWFSAHSPPLLVVHGDADTVNPLPSGQQLFFGSTGQAFLVTVAGGTHLGPFTLDPVRTLVARTVIDFLDAELRKDPGGLGRLSVDDNVPGVLSMP
jgi:alpha-beta hydrolase superfamily lysophospholipase